MENPVGSVTLKAIASAALLLCAGMAHASTDTTLHDPAESQLSQSLGALHEGRLDDAITQLDALLAEQPTFNLAHALRADIAAQLAGRDSVFAQPTGKLALLADEAKQRFAGQSNTARSLDLLPANLIEVGQHTDTIVLVDLSANRLYLYENRNGQLQLNGDHYVTIGKAGAGKLREGDNRTPIGLYRIQPFLTDAQLPELYGHGALPLDYPNTWDRHHGRTGYGIWIHGQPRDSYARPPMDSEGCVAISNRVIPDLNAWSTAGATPVIMVNAIDWVDSSSLLSMREDLARSIEGWRSSWSARNIDRFMSFHDAGFRNDNLGRDAFEARKRLLAERNDFQDIVLTDREMLLFEDVDGTPVAEVRFKQQYASPGYEDRSVKTQYWALREGQWRLTVESERQTPARNTPVQTADAAPTLQPTWPEGASPGSR